LSKKAFLTRNVQFLGGGVLLSLPGFVEYCFFAARVR